MRGGGGARAPAPLEGEVSPPHLSGVWEGVVAARQRAQETAEGIPSPQPPYIWKGWGRMESWGRGIPPAPTGRYPRRSLEEE